MRIWWRQRRLDCHATVTWHVGNTLPKLDMTLPDSGLEPVSRGYPLVNTTTALGAPRDYGNTADQGIDRDGGAPMTRFSRALPTGMALLRTGLGAALTAFPDRVANAAEGRAWSTAASPAW